MKIRGHRIEGVEFRAAHAYGGPMRPRLIVLHDTAGRLDKGSSVDWFCSDECSTSAHVVVERDGTITQQVPFDAKAFHAGASSWKGEQFCNGFAIGIEIVNPGKLDKNGRAWFHRKTERGFPVANLKRAKTREHGEGWWMPYTAEQIEAVTNLCKALIGAYPDIADITAHYIISPGRKIDVNPLFPLEEVRRAALRVRGEEEVDTLEPVSAEAEPAGAVASLLSDRNFAKLNDLADQGSRIASWIRSVKRWFWGGATTVSGGAMALAQTDKGSASIVKTMIAQHPFLVIAATGVVLAIVIYAAIKIAERYLLTAHKDGRYQPRGG